MASKVEYDLWDTVDWDMKWLVNFITGKTRLVSSDQFNDTVAIDVKRDRSVLEENYLLRCWGWLFLLNWIGALKLFLLLKLLPRKLEPWFILWSKFIELKIGQEHRSRLWVHDTPISEVIMVTLTESSFAVTNVLQGTWKYPHHHK